MFGIRSHAPQRIRKLMMINRLLIDAEHIPDLASRNTNLDHHQSLPVSNSFVNERLYYVISKLTVIIMHS